MSMEAFMAQVAWPGVQPSPLGEGEAPTAQESQPVPEVTPEETLEDTPATTATNVDYVADMTAARGGNEPSSLSRAFGSAYVRLDSARLVYYKVQAHK